MVSLVFNSVKELVSEAIPSEGTTVLLVLFFLHASLEGLDCDREVREDGLKVALAFAFATDVKDYILLIPFCTWDDIDEGSR